MKTKISYLGHACFMIESDDITIIIDPYFDNSVPHLTLKKNLSANYVYCSHEHKDHNAREYINIVPNNKNIEVEEYLIPHDNEGGRLRGMNMIRIFHIDGIRIAHLGDIGVIPNDKIINALKNVDVLLVPINGFYTLGAKDIYQLYKLTNPKIIIPMHYFNKDYQNGYPDGNQIDTFITLFKNIKYIDNYFIAQDHLNKDKVIIFSSYLQ